MIRILVAAIMIALSATAISSQQFANDVSQSNTTATPKEAEILGKSDALRRIALYEAAAHQVETSPPLNDRTRLKIYRQLGILYEAVAMYKKSEDAVQRAISLLRSGPQDELAEEIGFLSILHVAMGDVHKAEKEQWEALRIRERVGDKLGIGMAWSDLAAIYVKARNFKKAEEFAQKAFAVIGDDPRADGVDRISVRQTLATALCERHECARAILMLKDARELARTTFGPDSLAVGLADYILGTAYWRNGDMVDAEGCMQRGTARMKARLGWGQPSYVEAMTHYAAFLRLRGELEAAANAESEVVRANSVVDVSAFTTRH